MGYPTVKKGNKVGEIAKRPHPGVPLKTDVIIDLVKKFRGNLSRVADSIGCARSTIQDKMNREPELKKAVQDARERWIDDLEDNVWDRAVESNDTCLQLFLLKTQGKHRGYEQSEAQNTAKDIATAAFDFIINKSKNPAEKKK